jgi:hypothetical protein
VKFFAINLKVCAIYTWHFQVINFHIYIKRDIFVNNLYISYSKNFKNSVIFITTRFLLKPYRNFLIMSDATATDPDDKNHVTSKTFNKFKATMEKHHDTLAKQQHALNAAFIELKNDLDDKLEALTTLIKQNMQGGDNNRGGNGNHNGGGHNDNDNGNGNGGNNNTNRQEPDPELDLLKVPYLEVEKPVDLPICGSASSTTYTQQELSEWYDKIQVELIYFKQKYPKLTEDQIKAKLQRVWNLFRCFHHEYAMGMMHDITASDPVTFANGGNRLIEYHHILQYVKTKLLVVPGLTKFVDVKKIIQSYGETHGTLSIPFDVPIKVGIFTFITKFEKYFARQLGMLEHRAMYAWMKVNPQAAKLFVNEFGTLIENPPLLKYYYHQLHSPDIIDGKVQQAKLYEFDNVGKVRLDIADGKPITVPFDWSLPDIDMLLKSWTYVCVQNEGAVKVGQAGSIALINTPPVINSKVTMNVDKPLHPTTPPVDTTTSTAAKKSYNKPAGLSNINTELEDNIATLTQATTELLRFTKAQHASRSYYDDRRNEDRNNSSSIPYNENAGSMGGARFTGYPKYDHGPPGSHYDRPATPGRRISGGSRSHSPHRRIYTPGRTRSFTPSGRRQFTPRGSRCYSPGGSLSTPGGSRFTPRGYHKWTPRQYHKQTPRGTKITPKGSKYYNNGNVVTPRGRCYTPRGSQHTPGGSSWTPRGTFTASSRRRSPGNRHVQFDPRVGSRH